MKLETIKKIGNSLEDLVSGLRIQSIATSISLGARKTLYMPVGFSRKIYKEVSDFKSNPGEYSNRNAINMYFGTLLGITAAFGIIAVGQEVYDFVNREQLFREHGTEIAMMVGYNNPDNVIRAEHKDRPFGTEIKECGEKEILTLEDGTQLHYELTCSYELGKVNPGTN